jgi:hypothetical protein
VAAYQPPPLAPKLPLAAVCRRLERDLGRPVSVFDVVRTATYDAERARRHVLIRTRKALFPGPFEVAGAGFEPATSGL